jgi:hypothetical protein
MITHKKEIEEFLHGIGLLPYTNWKSITLEHGNREKTTKVLQQIREQKLKGGGIYIYTQNNAVLYVGIDGAFPGRIKDHYKESIFEEKDGRKGMKGDKHGDWPAFFKKYPGTITVYYRMVEESYERKIIELMLEYLLEPKFVEFKKGRLKDRKT